MRVHEGGETTTLAAYRRRHAQYRSDRDIRAAHAACPWLVTWDDHEVENNYADAVPETGVSPESFLRRRAAAYQAYYENMPLRPSSVPSGTVPSGTGPTVSMTSAGISRSGATVPALDILVIIIRRADLV